MTQAASEDRAGSTRPPLPLTSACSRRFSPNWTQRLGRCCCFTDFGYPSRLPRGAALVVEAWTSMGTTAPHARKLVCWPREQAPSSRRRLVSVGKQAPESPPTSPCVTSTWMCLRPTGAGSRWWPTASPSGRGHRSPLTRRSSAPYAVMVSRVRGPTVSQASR